MSQFPSLLFVYGTLRRGATAPLAERLLADAFWRGRASMRGKLYHIAWYPGLVETDNPVDRVVGDLYQLQDDAALWHALDEYEGCSAECPTPHEYQRVRREVVLENGTSYQAWVYLYQGSVEGKARIISGDFLQDATS